MLKEETSLLIVIDIQGNLARAAADRELLFESARKLIQGAKVFQLPIIVTEQIPEKLGATIPEIAGVLEGIGKIPKETFSCCANTAFMEAFKDKPPADSSLRHRIAHLCLPDGDGSAGAGL